MLKGVKHQSWKIKKKIRREQWKRLHDIVWSISFDGYIVSISKKTHRRNYHLFLKTPQEIQGVLVAPYYLQIYLVSLISNPFLNKIYRRASGYSVIDKLNWPSVKRTYVCVAFDWFRTNNRSFLGMRFNISYLSSVFDILVIIIHIWTF